MKKHGKRKALPAAASLTLIMACAGLGAGSIPFTEVSAAANEQTADETGELQKLEYVVDAAYLLTDEEWEELESRAEEISREYQCGVYIVTVDDYRDYSSRNVLEAGKTIYRDNALGYGQDRDGFLLLLSMEDRDYALLAYGDFGNAALTDYGKDQMADEFLDDFADNDWEDGFSDYLDVSEHYLKMAAEGTPFDTNTDPGDQGLLFVFSYGVFAVIGLIAAAVTCAAFKSQMQNVHTASGAANYLSPKGVDMKIRKDRYLHTTRTRRRIVRNSGSGGGHGTSVGRDGFSGKSGKF